MAIGIAPALMVAACSPADFAGTDKYELVGALGCSPIELVTCKTVDLEVPAGLVFLDFWELCRVAQEPPAQPASLAFRAAGHWVKGRKELQAFGL